MYFFVFISALLMFLARPINNGKEQRQDQHLTVVEPKVRFLNTTKSLLSYDIYLPS